MLWGAFKMAASPEPGWALQELLRLLLQQGLLRLRLQQGLLRLLMQLLGLLRLLMRLMQLLGLLRLRLRPDRTV
jgi:hypothetical protein